ncbi:c-type cytochrome domain-containing protein [Dyadobacter sandarakinus]|uniref:Chitobiase/beta-hexosaminidase C-terminal domain-containing protein n=1 Tax=Dyadobacter sandarakinus TaxID=2747268 RepID=A0ABX7I490_9BACT|nr:c-type cytochrome domain-containing protein [Dyadobacter sandarakinus]QRR00919.1 chitobiase/beta-hexosaminidase C-terminal domain-containing protein [Dyadobacter sandarakinus]
MHVRFRALAEQLLVAANVFILFLLIFEQKLVIPAWLQTIGRMHPLILHFPIVILLLAMLLEFFRFKPEYATNAFYKNFLQNLLLVGALLAAITVVMGLFLSREEGYSGDTLNFHKWTGAGIFFLASVIYWVRNTKWYRAPAARLGALGTIAGLVMTGHYGAALTHGADFIWEPVLAQQEQNAVSIENAAIYAQVIQPILDQKCTTCHNPGKIKGGLVLTDPESIRKGGKTGKLIIAGNPAMSLLLQRVHLPQEEKKHMPPAGKTQLTPDEITLLSLWVKQEASFKSKVTDLPAGDSLRLLATRYLGGGSVKEEAFDFAAADEEKINALNTDYRTILPLARESPALAVNIYNSSAFNAAQLEDLGDIKEQIVSLNLNKLPVRDADLKTIARFVNLRKLDLNFTDITGAGLRQLASLPHLHSLTLSGTKVTFDDLKTYLPGFKKLKTVTVWDTGLTGEQVARLQKQNRQMEVIGGFRDTGGTPLKLNPPQVKNASVIFGNVLALDLQHPIKGVDIRFTTDGSEPDSVHSSLFDHKTTFVKSQTIKARAYKNGWLGSDPVTFSFYKSAYKPDTISLAAPLNAVHQAEGARTFFDHKLGVIGANNPAWANNWAGVRNNDMVFVSEFKKPVALSSVGVHYMVEEATGIFPPQSVEVWGGADAKSMKLLTTFKAQMPVKGEAPSLRTAEGSFKTQTISCLKIVAKPIEKIPAWHPSKGNRALLLVDEMFLN